MKSILFVLVFSVCTFSSYSQCSDPIFMGHWNTDTVINMKEAARIINSNMPITTDCNEKFKLHAATLFIMSKSNELLYTTTFYHILSPEERKKIFNLLKPGVKVRFDAIKCERVSNKEVRLLAPYLFTLRP